MSTTDIRIHLEVTEVDALITDDHFTENVTKFDIFEIYLFCICVKRHIQIGWDNEYAVCCA